MLKSVLSFVIFTLVACSATASPIELKFWVDNLSASGGAPSANLQPFEYKIFLESSEAFPEYFTLPDGSSYGGVSFSQPNITNSPLTSIMLDHVAPYGLQFYSGALLNRQFNPNDSYFNPPITFQGISFETFGSSQLAINPLYPGVLTSTSYQRGIQKQWSLGTGNTVQAFNSESFSQYISTLVGVNTFQFQDASLVSSFNPVTNSGNTISLYGYFGRATLTAVTTVPLPNSYALFIVGLFVIGSALVRESHVGWARFLCPRGT